MKINLKEFYRFTQQPYKIAQYARRMREGRKEQVGAGVIFLVMNLYAGLGSAAFSADGSEGAGEGRQTILPVQETDGLFRFDDGPELGRI